MPKLSILSGHALTEGLVRLFETRYLIGLEAEGKGAGQFVETKGDLDDAGEIEAAACSALHQLSSYLQDLSPVMLDVAQRAQQEKQAGQRVDTHQIDHLLTAFRYPQNGKELLDLLGRLHVWQEKERYLLPLYIVELSSHPSESLIGKAGRASLHAQEEGLHKRHEVSTTVITKQGRCHPPIDIHRAIKKQALAEHIASGTLLTSGGGIEPGDEPFCIACLYKRKQMLLNALAIVTVGGQRFYFFQPRITRIARITFSSFIL